MRRLVKLGALIGLSAFLGGPIPIGNFPPTAEQRDAAFRALERQVAAQPESANSPVRYLLNLGKGHVELADKQAVSRPSSPWILEHRQRALTHFETLLTHHPKFPERDEALFHAGVLSIQLKDRQTGLERLQDLVKRYPQSSRRYDARLKLGGSALDAGTAIGMPELFREARGHFEHALSSTEPVVRGEALLGLARCAHGLNEASVAARHLDELERLAQGGAEGFDALRAQAQRERERLPATVTSDTTPPPKRSVRPLPEPRRSPAQWPDLSSAASPVGGGERDVAVIVALERYMAVPNIPGARENAEDWFRYLSRTRKVPLDQITLLRDNEATLEKMRKYAAAAAAQVSPGGTLWFIFIGHGAPSEDGTDGLLVGFDAQQDVDSLYVRSLSQRALLETLATTKGARALVVLDACFSGRAGTGKELIAGLQPLIPKKSQEAARANVTVLTAAKSDQFAGPLTGTLRPAFSYLVLGGLRGWADDDGDGKVTGEELIGYTRSALRATVRGRNQTPELLAAEPADALVLSAKEPAPDLGEIILGVEAR